MELEQSGWGKNKTKSLSPKRKMMICNDLVFNIYNLLINGLNCRERAISSKA